MNKPIFLETWVKLSPKAQKRFTLFCESPYHNKNLTLHKAILFIETHSPENDAEHLKKELFNHLYTGKGYDPSKISYIFSDLTILLKIFVSIEYDQRATIQAQYEMCKILRELNMDTLYKKEWKKLGQKIEHPKYQNSTTQYYTYKYHFEAQEQQTLKSRKVYPLLPDAIFNLEAHFIAESLHFACLNAGPQSDTKVVLSQKFLDEILKKVDAGNFDDSPAVVIYYYAYQILFNKSEPYFFKLFKWLEENWNLFPLNEIEDIYLSGINFCISKINSGSRDFMKHAFDLYRSGLSHKVFMKDGYLSIYNYKNILRLGLTQKAYEWTESFLYEFKEWLPKEEQENTFNYNLAYFYFQKKEYGKTMGLLRQVKFNDVYNNIDSRRMLLQIYYELEEWSALDSHLDSFQSYVVRQKNIGYHKTANLNLIKITRLMMKNFPLSAKSKIQIKKRINNASHLAEKNWVIRLAGITI